MSSTQIDECILLDVTINTYKHNGGEDLKVDISL